MHSRPNVARMDAASAKWLVKEPTKGDAAILKAEALGRRTPPALAQRLREVTGFVPRVDMGQLRALPPDTFGNAYARHMDALALDPFVISDWVKAEVIERQVFLVRLTACHDMLHVLLGFDVSIAGEMGVFAFTAAQRYLVAQRVGLWLVKLLYPVRYPFQAREILAAIRHGEAAARGARDVLAVRLEDFWRVPLVE